MVRNHRSLQQLFKATTWVVLLLCVAPIPECHAHSEYSIDGASQALAVHLETCHGGHENAQNWPKGWHWHLHFQSDDSGQCSAGLSALELEEVLESSTESVYEVDPWRQIAHRESPDDIIASCHRMNRPLTFTTVALLNGRQSLPELFCIIRC